MVDYTVRAQTLSILTAVVFYTLCRVNLTAHVLNKHHGNLILLVCLWHLHNWIFPGLRWRSFLVISLIFHFISFFIWSVYRRFASDFASFLLWNWLLLIRIFLWCELRRVILFLVISWRCEQSWPSSILGSAIIWSHDVILWDISVITNIIWSFRPSLLAAFGWSSILFNIRLHPSSKLSRRWSIWQWLYHITMKINHCSNHWRTSWNHW